MREGQWNQAIAGMMSLDPPLGGIRTGQLTWMVSKPVETLPDDMNSARIRTCMAIPPNRTTCGDFGVSTTGVVRGANTPREYARFPAHGSPRRGVGARGPLWRAPPRGVGTVSADGSVSSGCAGLWGERPESGGALRGPRAEVHQREEALGDAATRSHPTPTSICSEPSRFLSREAIPSCAEDVRFVAIRSAGFTETWRASRGRFDRAIAGWSARWTSTLAARQAG